MYQAHFGLSRPLFDSGIAQDAAVFLAPKHELTIANCKVALTTFDSAVVLTGTAGVGKTTLASCALRATSTRLALGWITGAAAHGGELLELLLAEFGFNAHRAGRVERMQMWRQFLSEMSTTESRVFVIAERADDLGPDVLRALDSLTAADPNGCPGANLVLLGQPALLDQLKAPAVESLRQRIRLRERLEPFTPEELRHYLAHQAARAGAELERLFAPNAIGTLHELSQGIPRVANNLCETALNVAAAGKERLLTSELLTRIGVAMFGIELPAAPGPAAAATAATPAPVPRPDSPAVHERALGPAPAQAVREPEFSAAVPAPAPAPDPAAVLPAATSAGDAAARAPIVSLTFAPPVSGAFVQSAPTYAPPAPASAPAASVAARPTPAPPRTEPTPIVTRTASASAPKPLQERVVRPPAAAAPASFPPVIESRASVRPPRPPEPEIDSFADTLTDTPDVQMPELPVLTDAVEPPLRAERPRARAETAYARHSPAPLRDPIAAQPQATPPAATTRSAAGASALSAPPKASAPSAPAAAAKPASQPNLGSGVAQEELAHQTQTVRALATAKSIDDISSSMAETLFGEADIDMLSAALASAGWSEDGTLPGTAPTKAQPIQEPPKTVAPPPRPKPAIEEDPFDLFGLGPDAPLELIDDSTPQNEHAHKAAGNR